MGNVIGTPGTQAMANGRFTAYVLITIEVPHQEKKEWLPGEFDTEAQALAAALAWIEANKEE